MPKQDHPEQSEATTSEATTSLIWTRPVRAHRERPALDREQIVRVALALADAEGIDAISLRRIATQLKVSAMALYAYIERKDDLLDLMIDAVYGELVLPPVQETDWREQLHAYAVALRAMLVRHAWFAALIGHRAVLGPNALKKTDYLLGVLHQRGFDSTTSRTVLVLFNAYVVGFVLQEVGEAATQRRTGLSKQEWQHHVGPYVQQIIASGQYPHLARVIREGEEPPADEMFAFGLARLLDSIAAYAANV